MPPTPSDPPLIAWCTVLETTSQTRSSVVGGGGGGLSYEGTGFAHVSPVETVHESLRELWVRYDNGVEDRLDFRNIDVPARAGHRLALLLCGKRILAVRNLSTGLRTMTVSGADYAGSKPTMGCGTIVAWSVLAAIGLIFAAQYAGPLFARWSDAPALQDPTNTFFLVCNPVTALCGGLAGNVAFHRWHLRQYRSRHDKAQAFLDHWIAQLDWAAPPEDNPTNGPVASG